LAAFGRPKFADQVRKVIRVSGDGTYSIADGYFNLLGSGWNLFTREFLMLFQAPRDYRAPLPFDCLEDDFTLSPITDDDQRYADIAASLQVVLEDALLGLARRVQRVTASRRLCIAGGVALNAVANTRMIEDSGFDEVFIPPDPGDGGAAIGAALLECARMMEKRVPRSISPWMGRAFATDPAPQMVRHLDPADWIPFRIDRRKDVAGESLAYEECDSLDDLIGSVAEALLAGRIVGWLQGRFELGHARSATGPFWRTRRI